MRYWIFIIMLFLSVFLSANPSAVPSKDTPVFKMDYAEVSLDYNYRYKTSRTLSRPDIPQLSYASAFTFNTFYSLSLSYGSFPFKQTEQHKVMSQSLAIGLSFFSPLNDAQSLIISASGDFVYYTDKTNPSEYSTTLNMSYSLPLSIFKLNFSGGFFLSYTDSISNEYNHQESQEFYVPSLSLNIRLPMGFFVTTAHAMNPYFHIPFNVVYDMDGNPISYSYGEQERFYYWKHTLSIGAQLFLLEGVFLVFGQVSKTYSYELGDYPFDFKKTIKDTSTDSAMIRFTYFPTPKRDISLYLSLMNRKTLYDEDMILAMGVSFVLQ